jgi:hypothetical protein
VYYKVKVKFLGLIKHHAMKRYGEWKHSSKPQHYVVMNNLVPYPAALTPSKKPPVPI